MGIQINGNTNNINAGIGSLSIEDINELDIVGVATAANFKTGVSNLHSVGLTLSGGQIDVGSNIKIGTAGVVTATSFVGSTNTDGTSDILTLHADADGTNNGVASIKLMGNAGNHAAFIKGGHTTNGDTILTFHTDAHDSGINPEERLRITSTGTVGIGTVNPNAPLDVFSNISASNKDLFMVRSATGAFAVQCSNITAANPEWRLRTYSSEPIVFSPGNVEKLRITSAGNVGINSTNPNTPLEIHTAASQAWKFRINTSVSDGAGFYQRSNGDFELVLRDASNNNNYIAGTSGALQFTTSGSERLRITSAGKLGVGNASPSFLLDVKGATTDTLRISNSNETGHGSHDAKIVAGGSNYHNMRFESSSYKFITFDGSSTYERLRIESGGNVRVSDQHLRFDTTGKGIIFGIDGGSNRPSIIGNYTSSSDNNMVFNVTGTERLRIDSSGIVNIGVSSPQYAKKVNIQGGNDSQISVSNQDYTGYAAGSMSGIEGRIQCGNSIWSTAGIRFKKFNGTIGDKHTYLELYATDGYANKTGLVIQPDGEVTKPLQPSFAAIGVGGNYTIGNLADFPFSSEQFDTTSNYNTSNYRFTCPVDGRYLFWFNIFTYGTQPSGENRIWFKINGNNGIYGQQSVATNNNLKPWSASIVADLDANDYVTVGTWQTISGTQIYQGHSGWGGYLLG